MAEFTQAEVLEALQEFLPDRLAPSYSVDGYQNVEDLVPQVLAIVSNVLVRDPDAPYYLRSIAAEGLLADTQSAISGVDGVTAELLKVKGEPLVAPPTSAAVDAVSELLPSLAAASTAGFVPGSALQEFADGMDALIADVASSVVGSAGETAAQAAVEQVVAVRDSAHALGRRLTQFDKVEAEFRAAEIRPLLLVHLSNAVANLLEELQRTLSEGKEDYYAQARSYLLRLGAARQAVVDASTLASATANSIIDSSGTPTSTVVEHRDWGAGSDAAALSETAAVVEGSTGVVLPDSSVASGSTGFTRDYESDAVAGASPGSASLSGPGPFSFQLDAGVLVDVSWQPGTQISDGTTALLLGHDGAAA